MARAKDVDLLDQLATSLKLSPQKRKFAEAYAVDPSSKTKAARKAGSKRPAEQGSRWSKDEGVIAYIRALHAAVQARREAAQAAQPPAQEETQDRKQLGPLVLPPVEAPSVQVLAQADLAPIASLEEALAFHTTVLRSRLGDYVMADGEADVAALKNAPAGLVKSYRIQTTTDEDGRVHCTQTLALESAAGAANSLIRHYDAIADREVEGAKVAAEERRTRLLAALASLTPEQVEQLRAAFARQKPKELQA